jgi:hypothetical protein
MLNLKSFVTDWIGLKFWPQIVAKGGARHARFAGVCSVSFFNVNLRQYKRTDFVELNTKVVENFKSYLMV